MSAFTENERHDAWQFAQRRAFESAKRGDYLADRVGEDAGSNFRYRQAEVWSLVATALRRDTL